MPHAAPSRNGKGVLSDVPISLSVCLSPSSTLNLHSAEGAAAGHDTAVFSRPH